MDAADLSREQLIAHVAELNAELGSLHARLREARDESDWIGGSLKRRTAVLSERVKELECVYQAMALARDLALSVEQRASRIVDLLPRAWQHPGSACARAVLRGREHRSASFAPSDWTLSEPILDRGEDVGFVEVRYLRAFPSADEGPFLREERALLRAIASCLGSLRESDAR